MDNFKWTGNYHRCKFQQENSFCNHDVDNNHSRVQTGYSCDPQLITILKLVSLELHRIEEKTFYFYTREHPVQLQASSNSFSLSESLHPLDGSDTRGSCGQHTRDDKEQIGYDSALCRREATEDHRSRAGEYEWWPGSNRAGATLLRREICKKETGTTRNPSIRFDRAPSIPGWFVFKGRLTNAELDFIKGDASFGESCNDANYGLYFDRKIREKRRYRWIGRFKRLNVWRNDQSFRIFQFRSLRRRVKSPLDREKTFPPWSRAAWRPCLGIITARVGRFLFVSV